MRKPRPQDFDPDYEKKATAPKPEAIDVSGVVPIKTKSESKEIYDRTENRSEERSVIRTEERTEKRTPSLPVKRITKRYSFEFYEDQLTRLKQIKYELEMTGERIAMSVIVRDALDEYLEKQKDSV